MRAAARRLLLTSATVLLTVLALLGTALSAPAAPAAVPAAPAAATSTAAVAQRDAPTRDSDFPLPPKRCYDDRGDIVSPCRLTFFKKRPWMVVWGDSHAQMYLPPMRYLARTHRVNLVFLLAGGCPVSQPFPQPSDYRRTGCETHNVESLAYVADLRKRAEVRLVIGGFWSGYRHAYELLQRERETGQETGLSDYHERMAALAMERARPMFKKIGRLRIPVDLIAPAAAIPIDPPQCDAGRDPYQCDLPRTRALRSNPVNKQWLRSMLQYMKTGGPRLIDPSPTYCDAQTCFAHVNGANTYYDDIHLGKQLASMTTSYFRPSFRALVRGR